MKLKTTITILILTILCFGCNSYQYIHDKDSEKRQRELQQQRSVNFCGDMFLFLGSMAFEAATGEYIGYFPEGQAFKRVNLVNTTNDTMFVNMLTDVYWDEEDYCDFMDIRIPPQNNCRLLVPMDANYNIYFGTSENPEEDQLKEIFTTNINRIKLIPVHIPDSLKILPTDTIGINQFP